MFGPQLPYYVKDTGLFGEGVLHWAAAALPGLPDAPADRQVVGPIAAAMNAIAVSWTLMRRSMRETDEGGRNFVRDIYRKMGATTWEPNRSARPDPAVLQPSMVLFADTAAGSRAAGTSRSDPTRYREALALIEVEVLDRSLDGRPGYSPIQRLSALLDATGVRWGILTDGARWRIYRAGSYTYYEVNLEAILQQPPGDAPEAFRWIYAFIRPGAFPQGATPSFLDQLWAEAHAPAPIPRQPMLDATQATPAAEEPAVADAITAEAGAIADGTAAMLGEEEPADEEMEWQDPTDAEVSVAEAPAPAHPVASAPVAKAPPATASPTPPAAPADDEGMSFADAAEETLRRQGEPRPLHYRIITEKAIELGLLMTHGKTPASTMSAQILRDMERCEKQGIPPRFFRQGPGIFGLTDWQSRIFGQTAG